MLILDLFCGGGGASMGLHRAFPDAEIIGVDNRPMPRYPFTFIRADAMTFPLDGYDLIWASPPCQAYSRATGEQRNTGAATYPDLIATTRSRLQTSETPYIIENVVLAPLIDPILLCGQMFGLRVLRHRLFETSFPAVAPPHRSHAGLVRGITADFICCVNGGNKAFSPGENRVAWQEAMGIEWMTRREMSQAIPPAYAQYVGQQLPRG